MLGAGVARALAERGDIVTVMQRRTSAARLAGIEGVREVLGDIADAEVVRRAVQSQDGVVHLAAKVDVTGPWTEFDRVNVLGTSHIVAACKQQGVARLVQVSSPSVAHAGRSLVGVGAEPADPDGARGNYARSKALAEQIALAADSAEFAVVAVRPHLVWGPGDTQLIGRIVDRARSGRLPVLGSGASLIDTTYVSNAVDALVAALDRADVAHGQALVVSNGEPRPIGELLTDICCAAGVMPPRHHLPSVLGVAAGAVVQSIWPVLQRLRGGAFAEPPLTRFLAEQLSTAHWFDQRHTREVLAWSPQVDLDEGFARLAAYSTTH